MEKKSPDVLSIRIQCRLPDHEAVGRERREVALITIYHTKTSRHQAAGCEADGVPQAQRSRFDVTVEHRIEARDSGLKINLTEASRTHGFSAMQISLKVNFVYLFLLNLFKLT